MTAEPAEQIFEFEHYVQDDDTKQFVIPKLYRSMFFTALAPGTTNLKIQIGLYNGEVTPENVDHPAITVTQILPIIVAGT